ncbi:MAG TPA: glycoside hydrolase family 140 protein, partial [Chitinophagaceae bacterium]|nr:glycoside hydrolase family 140 protein [Chitinophagaceae bacterium]
KWLGNRYKNFPNIIWILGGDRPPVNDSVDKKELWRAMAKGIIEGTNKKAFITYHPSGESSSATFWPNESWLDIQMLQSGHAKKDNPVWEWIKRDREIVPTKPIVDGEPNYEDHPINWNKNNGYFRDYDVRRQCYRSVFSGACGVTYGNQAMWQFYSEREQPVAFPERSWIETLDRPGAFQVGYLRKLIESRSVNDRIPDQSIISAGQGEKMEYATAFRGNKYCMIYFPTTKGLTLNLSFLPATQIRIWWYHPGKGQAGKPELMQKFTTMIFTPPSTGTETDWVLIIDDASKKFSEPGK